MTKKTIVYGRGFRGQALHVTYVIIAHDCVFTGLENGSTINWAEDIIRAICCAESCEYDALTFYDLQTHRGYKGKQPGQYELDRLSVELEDGRVCVRGWIPAPKWPLILETFAEEIGGSGPPVNISRRPQD